jgi:hypothetical protein
VVRGGVAVGVDVVLGVVDDPPPLAAAAMPTPLTAATAAEASTTAYLRMDIGTSPFVHGPLVRPSDPAPTTRSAAAKPPLSPR